jgi:hypothetical protein
VYGRNYAGKELHFEASGGLVHYSLVMRDKETDSYWSLMTGEALAGTLEGTRLIELPIGEKAQWKDWLAEHPETLVLSVDGVEHESNNPYEGYFDSDEGFRGSAAKDDRLPTKAPIYSFQLEGRAYAVPFEAIESGAAFRAGDEWIFAYRPSGAAILHSTVAFQSRGEGFEQRDGVWHHRASGARFDRASAAFDGQPEGVSPLNGFDTFWFNWSMNHPDSVILTEAE